MGRAQRGTEMKAVMAMAMAMAMTMAMCWY